ncbi:hypothetical protein [Chondromyces apiculatus]|uniref:Uncharacterized protein n=1 Tax=Chondromyces apiculatus DSM 436 TaxID=1192034 RepID=A0A017SWA7_9BACT|nr:hypothetical protein [Chondromyces apiculatus]EYF00561.1 Hypothetical protein CAP_0490 [Chondromyces apiculatus DSM 436]
MQLPSSTASSESHLEYAAHFTGAEEAWRDAEIISAEQRAVIQEVGASVAARAQALKARHSSAELTEGATSRARARFGVRDVVLGMRVMACSDGLLNGPAQRSRDHALYKSVMLGRTASAIKSARPREEPELVERVRTQLAEAPDFTAKAGLLTSLDDALERSFEARDALDLAESAENQAADAEIAARRELRQALDQAYGRLRAAFPGQRDFVESFFLRKTRKKVTQASEPGRREARAAAR